MTLEATISDLVSKHTPALPAPICDITEADAATFLKAKRLNWLTVDRVMSNERLYTQAAAHTYAGENPMSHHDTRVKHGGMAGALEVFVSLMDAAPQAKIAAGGYITSAREYRALGDLAGARRCLAEAAKWRRKATPEQPEIHMKMAAE